MSLEEDIDQRLAWSEDQLYADLAAATTGAGLMPSALSERIQLGRARFAAIRDLVAAKVCDPAVREQLAIESDSKKLAVAVADILSTLLTGQPLVIIALLIAKVGLDTFCPVRP